MSVQKIPVKTILPMLYIGNNIIAGSLPARVRLSKLSTPMNKPFNAPADTSFKDTIKRFRGFGTIYVIIVKITAANINSKTDRLINSLANCEC